jgi:hypothetical protein
MLTCGPVPVLPGAGLSSSAALGCSVALALTELYQVPVPRRELAALARPAENDVVGDPGAPARLTEPSLRRLCGHVIAENGCTVGRPRSTWPQCPPTAPAAS